jgi:uncharacterized membrane protein YfcA
MEDPSLLTLLWLFALALVAAIVDAMAGGGGLLTVPGLLATGIDPVSALATNKFQGVFGPLSATLHFRKKQRIKLRKQWLPAVAAFLGGALGAFCVTQISPEALKTLLPILLIALAVWVLLQPRLGEIAKKARISAITYGLIFAPVIGFHDGFIGPGTGSFFALSGVALLGLTLDEATIRAKLYNFMSNLGPLCVFLIAGKVIWIYGCVMAVGTMIGGNIGARLILAHGTKLVKPILVVMSLLMSAKLLWQQGILQKLF